MVAKLAKIGIVPGPGLRRVASSIADFAKRIPEIAFDRIMLQFKVSDGDVQRHQRLGASRPKTGVYGTDYLQRALVTAIGLGANRPQDAVYPTSLKDDARQQAYDGANKYVMHFAEGPDCRRSQGFWSLTMYDASYFFVANPINRYSISAAAEPQGERRTARSTSTSRTSRPARTRRSNWLPAPDGKFILMLRLYWPDETPPSILDGTWKPPAVKKVS